VETEESVFASGFFLLPAKARGQQRLTWQLGSLAAWQLGSLAAWQLGSLAAWQLGSLAASLCVVALSKV
jgi:hypothetical protein